MGTGACTSRSADWPLPPAQQGNATWEISRNVVIEVDGTKSVLENLENVSASTASTESAVKDVDVTANAVAETVGRLKSEVEGFLNKVAAALGPPSPHREPRRCQGRCR